LLVAVGLALLALVLLAAALPRLEFRAAQHFAVGQVSSGEAEETEEAEPAELALLEMMPPEAGLSLGYVIVLVLLPVAIVWLIVSPKARKEVLVRLIPFLLMAALLLLRSQHPEVLRPVEQQPLEVSGTVVPLVGNEIRFDPTPPAWLRWAVSAGIGLLLALAVGVAAWMVWRRRQRSPSPLERLAEEAHSALRALRAGGDVRDTILRCYFEMSRVVSQERSLTRHQSMTPREFEERLAAAGLPQSAVRRLTRLFEQVRYGAAQAAQAEEQEALDCLEEVVEACRVGVRELGVDLTSDPAGAGDSSFAPGMPG
jgi:hypothetical protein